MVVDHFTVTKSVLVAVMSSVAVDQLYWQFASGGFLDRHCSLNLLQWMSSISSLTINLHK